MRAKLEATDPTTVELDSGQYQLVEFFAFWSPLSKSMAPVVHLLEAKHQGRMGFVYLDVDDRANTAFKRTLGYRFVPHFFVLDPGGNILDDWYGYMTAENFEERMLGAIGVGE